ncbi:MAG: hypothetical protein ACLTXP_14680 [Odoribacter splanchnicus]
MQDIDPANNEVVGLIPQILPGSTEEFGLLADFTSGKGYGQGY